MTTRTKLARAAGRKSRATCRYRTLRRNVGSACELRRFSESNPRMDLVFGESVHRDVDRVFQSLGNHHERGTTAELDADFLVSLSVHYQGCRNLNVGFLKCHQFLLPILVFELEEQGAERPQIIEGNGRRNALDSGRCEPGPGLADATAAVKTAASRGHSARFCVRRR